MLIPALVCDAPRVFNRGFQLAASMSALCGFLISFCSLWFLSTTTATTFSLVGSLNKARSPSTRGLGFGSA